MKTLIARLWHEEDGQDLTEYALLLVLITLAAVTSTQALATSINGVLGNVVTVLSSK